MNRTASLVLTATIFFLAGLLSYAGAQRYLSTYLSGIITVQGVLEFQAHNSDIGNSGHPPYGYFVASTAIGRIYVEGDLIMQPYVGARVWLEGETLSNVCGRDGFPCYPNLLITSVALVPKQK